MSAIPDLYASGTLSFGTDFLQFIVPLTDTETTPTMSIEMSKQSIRSQLPVYISIP